MRYALYFGSFNPLHTGHIAIAKYVMEHCNIDGLRLVLSPQSPFKTEGILQDAQIRLAALQESVARFNATYTGQPLQKCTQLEISTVEFNLSRPNYTYNTLKYFQKTEPDNTFILVMGADNLASLEKWYKGKEILSEFEIVVYPRKGYDTQALCEKYGAQYLDAPLKDISSTMIREGEQKGLDMSNFKY